MEYNIGTDCAVYVDGKEIRRQTRVSFCDYAIMFEVLSTKDDPVFELGDLHYRVEVKHNDEIMFSNTQSCSAIFTNGEVDNVVTKIYYFGESDFLVRDFAKGRDIYKNRRTDMLIERVIELMEGKK